MKKFIVFFCVTLFVLISCVESRETSDPTLNHLVLGQDVNQSILVSVPQGWNTYKMEDPVTLAVISESNTPIYVSENDISVDVLENNIWLSVNTIRRDSFYQDVIYFYESEAQRTVSLQVKIDISSGKYNNNVFRFTVVGYKYENQEKTQKVFATVDIELFK